jgi:NO-binding membrane sensor protein with MHYT domain
MQVSYEPWLVLLSIVIAIEGAYIGLRLTVQIGAAAGLPKRLLLASAALALGVAIWAMHFIAMLAAGRPFALDYLVFPTLLSFLVCVLMAGVAVYAMSSGSFTLARLALSSGLLAAAIITMHYTGMAALNAGARVIDDPPYVAGSVVIALAGSALALWLAISRGGRPPLFRAATAFGFAVAAIHYVAAAGTTLVPHAVAASGAPVLSSDVLAIVVAVVAFCVSGVFFLLLVPDRAGPETPKAALARPAFAENGAEEVPVALSAAGLGGDAKLRRGIYAPLGGAGAPPSRVADHLPIERDGATQFVAVDEVVAVQANAHYTYLFDGTTKLFCPLAIGEVESRLDRSRFMRVHRSHIINIKRVIGYRRSGDSEIVELAADSHYAVPVSRGRVGWLKAQIGEQSGASEADDRSSSDTAT